jgi:hypothetical protein
MGTRWPRFVGMLGAPLMLAGVLTGLEAAPASALTCQAWTGALPPSPGQVNELAGVAVVSACNVWAVGTAISDPGGAQTLIEHWAGGSSWTVVPSPDPGGEGNHLVGVDAVSPTDIWAVGSFTNDASSIASDQTLIEHWNGTTWTVVPGADLGPGPRGSQLTGVRAVSAGDVWAVGVDSHGQTLIEHWDGTTWARVPSPSPGTGNFLAGVSATSASDAWAVGEYSSGNQSPTLILHWDGTTWTQVPSPSPGGFLNALNGVHATSASNAWAVGISENNAGGPQTLIEHWDGTAWTQVPSPSPQGSFLAGVTVTPAHTAFAVGSEGFRQPLVLRWDGSSWSQAATPPEGDGNALEAIGASPAGDVWVAGSSSDATRAYAAPIPGTRVPCCL